MPILPQQKSLIVAMASPFKYVMPDRSEPSAPFVICLGWVNCRMRTLQKYGQVSPYFL